VSWEPHKNHEQHFSIVSTETDGYPPETADEPDFGPAGDEAVAQAPTHHRGGSNGPGCTLDISASLHALVPVSGLYWRADGTPDFGFIKSRVKICSEISFSFSFLHAKFH